MECLKHQKTFFFSFFPCFLPPRGAGGAPYSPYFPTLGCYAVGSTSGAVYPSCGDEKTAVARGLPQGMLLQRCTIPVYDSGRNDRPGGR